MNEQVAAQFEALVAKLDSVLADKVSEAERDRIILENL